MRLDTLTSISPVDGRYRDKTVNLAAYFSEYALMKYRILVEIEYFISLCEWPLPQLSAINKPDVFESLRKIYANFSLEDAEHIKGIEKITNHDVKAVEYFIKEAFEKIGLGEYKEFIHFGLTSQDINNTAIPLSIKDALQNEYFPQLYQLIEVLEQYAREWENTPMMAKTHGQPASPTRLGKEIKVFVSRLQQQTGLLKQIPVSVKSLCKRETGNFADKCSKTAFAIPKFPSAFSKSMGFTLCGIADEPISPGLIFCLKYSIEIYNQKSLTKSIKMVSIRFNPSNSALKLS
ncbi:hypothetical protein AGMMS50239_16400 [Bacteroidia bacterium]|nr:hypothetical protein AGMMS50239_16400 [Bacteroidia bacterium]